MLFRFAVREFVEEVFVGAYAHIDLRRRFGFGEVEDEAAQCRDVLGLGADEEGFESPIENLDCSRVVGELTCVCHFLFDPDDVGLNGDEERVELFARQVSWAPGVVSGLGMAGASELAEFPHVLGALLGGHLRGEASRRRWSLTLGRRGPGHRVGEHKVGDRLRLVLHARWATAWTACRLGGQKNSYRFEHRLALAEKRGIASD